jgi:4-carboxymuconolactone decarboxylase
MTGPRERRVTVGHARLESLDAGTASLIRLSARITGGTEMDVRTGFAECKEQGTHPRWVEELVLQSYLFAGFPRALNAAREWRRVFGSSETLAGSYRSVDQLREAGEQTCAIVYGDMYEKLRENIRGLHSALDEWMIVEGYGKVLSRAGLDLPRRELCIVAACVAAGQERQLHSHLHGARNAGVADAVVQDALLVLDGVVEAEALKAAHLLWQRVKGK